MEIGKKLRELRLLNQLTLEELAGRCELSKGFLSQVERDLTSPSIATLEDILEALGSSLSEFFAESRNDQIVFSPDDFFELEKEDHSISWIVPNAQKNDMEPILLLLPPKGKSFRAAVHDGEEFGYVLDGDADLVSDKSRVSLHKGWSFYIRGSREHHLENPSSSAPARIIWISCPPAF